MNWDQIEGNWKEFKGDVKKKWGELTDDELTQAAGNRDKLSGCLQQRYGLAKEEAERQMDEFAASRDARRRSESNTRDDYGSATRRPF